MESNNLYSNNADVKFPLIDTHSEDIPNAILTGLSISVPEGIVPTLTGLRVGIGFVFAVFEDLNTGDAVADVRIDSPQAGVIYPLNMSVSGNGFIMFGPGIFDNTGYFSGQVSVTLETEVVTELAVQPTEWGLIVNTLDYELSNILTLLSANDLITITVEAGKIYVDRNDSVIDEISRSNFVESTDIGGEDPRVFTIAGTLPDIDGNIDIDVEGCIERCDDVNNLDLDRGDAGAGDHVTLPLDIYFPPVPNPLDPCAPSATSSGSGSVETEEELCQNIYKQTILNENLKEVGTLYSNSSDSSASSGSSLSSQPSSNAPTSGSSNGSSTTGSSSTP